MAPGVLPTALSLAFASAAAIAPTREQTPARGPNLAFHRPASQSSRSQWSRPADPQGGVDGVKTGAYGFHTEYEPKPWWAVDLQQVAELDELRIYNSRKAPEAARTIQVWLSSDGVDWTRAYAHDGSLFGGADGPLRVWPNGRRARHVRVQLAHTDYLHLNEIEVYGRPVAESSGIASPVVSAGRSQAPALRAGGFGPETETARTRVTGESGGYVRLANGARFEVPRGVVTGEAEVRVHRAIPAGAATRAGLLSDVHYLDSDVRPKLAGHLSLRVPLGVGQAPEDAAAYAVFESGLVYGIPGRIDAATLTMVIEDPEIAVIPWDAPRLPAVRADRVPRVGYAVGPAAGLSPHPTCLSGAPGEIHDQPGHSFRVVFHVQAPCALARQVSDVLQQALEAYDADFQDANGQRPFPQLSPESRTWVYLLADGPISQYEHSRRWNGTMRVNVALARADPARLREALFRELFHAVQDAHPSVSLAGSAQWVEKAPAPTVAAYALADTRPSPDRALGVSWSYGDEDAIEDVTYPDGRREIRRFALTARPPQTIVPGVPFTIAVTAAARDEGGVGSAQHDVRPVFYADAGDGGEQLDARGWVKGDSPTVGTHVATRAFTARATGRWTVTLPGEMPESFVLELRIRAGIGAQPRDSGWLRFRYRRR